ncbi:hypothetical protein ABH905_002090 [Pseudomonas frederiksbergensis]|uniref:hypothetical protein n=1 Tax=Pseudomonas frederiksbergensis TaxID=104087 RepID=UPI003D230A37
MNIDVHGAALNLQSGHWDLVFVIANGNRREPFHPPAAVFIDPGRSDDLELIYDEVRALRREEFEQFGLVIKHLHLGDKSILVTLLNADVIPVRRQTPRHFMPVGKSFPEHPRQASHISIVSSEHIVPRIKILFVAMPKHEGSTKVLLMELAKTI